jgi:hypothetical protein
VLKVPLAGGDVAWFKACSPQQSFEPRLTSALGDRWPDRVAEVLGYDERSGWLLLADAGEPIGATGNPPEAWLEALPRYAELQLGETAHVAEHLQSGVPDVRVATLRRRYEELLSSPLPLDASELDRLRDYEPQFGALADELAAAGVSPTVQHDDLHHGNLYPRGRVLDWGDASVGHPFFSLVVTFRFLEERTGLTPGDPWFGRLRDAYLEPFGPGLADVFALAYLVGGFARAFAYPRVRRMVAPAGLPEFDADFRTVLLRALAAMSGV